MSIELAKEAAQRLETQLRDQVEEVYEDKRGVVVRIVPDSLLKALTHLKSDKRVPFNMLADATGSTSTLGALVRRTIRSEDRAAGE